MPMRWGAGMGWSRCITSLRVDCSLRHPFTSATSMLLYFASMNGGRVESSILLSASQLAAYIRQN
jgi:hypothetical protein